MSAGNREHYKGSHLSITQVDEIFVNLGDVLKHKQIINLPSYAFVILWLDQRIQ